MVEFEAARGVSGGRSSRSKQKVVVEEDEEDEEDEETDGSVKGAKVGGRARWLLRTKRNVARADDRIRLRIFLIFWGMMRVISLSVPIAERHSTRNQCGIHDWAD